MLHALTRPQKALECASLSSGWRQRVGVIYPVGFIVLDEHLDMPILSVGFDQFGSHTVEWHPNGYTPAWLQNGDEL